MKILITNDDSISASQLLPLIRWCQKLGQVTVVAPRIEQSGKSHGIEIRNPFGYEKVQLAQDISAYAIDSTPADCVRFAVLGLQEQFDLVISGINRGYNIGTDAMYSGTVAAVTEAAILGISAIALSTSPGYYEHAVEQLDRVFDFIRDHNLLGKHSMYNINIPPENKGIRITRQGGVYYSDDFLLDENGMCHPLGKCVYEDRCDLTLDTDAVMHGYISILPLTTNMTDMGVYSRLAALTEPQKSTVL
ncbi:MAG: 5'/3'-nucleotidase SurE [Oscillospiraceae bacterium]|nr:5'/3'-nucleotidase SurE [Oscillospiraceae bacterium]